jgi:hypothetical protein
MNFNRARKKYLKRYNKEVSGENEVPVNSIVIYIFGAIFISILLAILTQKIVKPVVINPFLLLLAIFLPSIALVYLVFLSIKYFNLRIFSDRYSFSAIYTDLKDAPIQTVRNFNNNKIDFSIIPLGGAIVRDFIPIRGGGREGFLVVDKNLAMNLGGTIFVMSDLIVATVEALPIELRARIQNHSLYKPYTKIYFGALEKRINGMSINEYLEMQNNLIIRDFWALYDAVELYNEHLEKMLNVSDSHVKRLKNYE